MARTSKIVDPLADVERIAPGVATFIREVFPELDQVARLDALNREITRLEREVRQRGSRLRRLGSAFGWQRVGGRYGTR